MLLSPWHGEQTGDSVTHIGGELLTLAAPTGNRDADHDHFRLLVEARSPGSHDARHDQVAQKFKMTQRP